MNIIQELQSNRPKVVHFFYELVKVLPKGVHLNEVSRDSAQVTLVGKAESNSSVSELMRNVNENAWLSHPVLSEIKTEKIDGKYISYFRMNLNLSNQQMHKESNKHG